MEMENNLSGNYRIWTGSFQEEISGQGNCIEINRDEEMVAMSEHVKYFAKPRL